MSTFSDEPTVHPVQGYPAPDWVTFTAQDMNNLHAKGKLYALPISGDATTIREAES